MKVIKRDGREVTFDSSKITFAVQKAFVETSDVNPIPEHERDDLISTLVEKLVDKYNNLHRAIGVEEIQDDVVYGLMDLNCHKEAMAYMRYRYAHEAMRNGNTTDNKIMSIVDGVNETVIQENANKNPSIVSTQRDYIAGEVSRDMTERLLIPSDIAKAHRDGIIHFHDSDYFVQREHNCCLVNLDDMLQNGTVISGTLIEKPHSFATACNIATQIVAQIASCQYGGQSISLAHLAPFVDVSRKKIREEVDYELNLANGTFNRDYGAVRDVIVEHRVRDEVKKGVQTIQYQINTLMTTNGQTPFVTVFMYLGEAKSEDERNDLAMIIEEVLRQRIQGVKNEQGVWITPAFPKLIYVLEEDNIREDSKYFSLTHLAAQCTAKRMVPDYISEKKMLELKVDENGEGHCYTCINNTCA